MPISSYSTTPGSNTAINGINIAEGCAPSAINDAIRQLMADIASGAVVYQKPTVSGTANAIVLTCTPAQTANTAGQYFVFVPTADNTGAATVNWGGGVVNITKNGSLALVANDLLTGVPAQIFYDGTQAVLLNPKPYSQGAAIASAATLVLNTMTGDYGHVTGTTGITAITLRQGEEKTLVFDGALTITNGASLITGTGSNISAVANDCMVVRGEASGVVRIVNYRKADGTALVSSGSISYAEQTVASASTTDIGASGVNGVSNILISGTTTITSLGSSAVTTSPLYSIRFSGALTLTYNATSLILPTGASITTAAGDSMLALYLGSGNWRVLKYTKFSGAPLLSGSGADLQTFTGNGTWTKPASVTASSMVLFKIWDGGASGASRSTTGNANGGAGGAYGEIFVPASVLAGTETITVAASVAGVSGNTTGNNGNQSSVTINGVTYTISTVTARGGVTAATGGTAASAAGGVAATMCAVAVSGGATGSIDSANTITAPTNTYQSGPAGGSCSSTAGGTRTGASALQGTGGAGGANTGGAGTAGTGAGAGGGGAVQGGTSGAGSAGRVEVVTFI